MYLYLISNLHANFYVPICLNKTNWHFQNMFCSVPSLEQCHDIRNNPRWKNEYHHHFDINVFFNCFVYSRYCLQISIQNVLRLLFCALLFFASLTLSPFKFRMFHEMVLESIYILLVINVPNFMFLVISVTEKSHIQYVLCFGTIFGAVTLK